MPADEFPHECCGELPVTIHSVMLTHCHTHQAWSVHWSIVDHFEDEPKALLTGHVNLGPFDDESALQEALAKARRAVFQ